MNRRHFFGMTLAGVVAAGLPEILLPEKSIFLPPRGGWQNWTMREIDHYRIINDVELTQWAAAWLVDGRQELYYCDMLTTKTYEERLRQRIVAADTFNRIEKTLGWEGCKRVLPRLPRDRSIGRYV